MYQKCFPKYYWDFIFLPSFREVSKKCHSNVNQQETFFDAVI